MLKYSEFLRNLYGEKVYKIPINTGGTCPNRDGTKGVGGCIFCSECGARIDKNSKFCMKCGKPIDTNKIKVGEAVAEAIEGAGFKYVSAEHDKIPSTYVTLDNEDDIKYMNLLIEHLEDNDDVTEVYHNWENCD